MNLPIFEQTRAAVPDAPVSGNGISAPDSVAPAVQVVDDPIVIYGPPYLSSTHAVLLALSIVVAAIGGVLFLVAVFV